jgi:hypothetical protein
MTTFLVRLAGPNYRVRLTGLAEALAVILGGAALVPYQLGEVSLMVSPEMKAPLLKAAFWCYLVSKVLNSWWSKADNVVGNNSTGVSVSSSGSEVANLPPINQPPASQNPRQDG